ncbi:LexA family transcriptional regulator [Chitinasiproducens palmae]|uniref:Phage repressor protein C, contains Cro/C1-type HTH and peptisase s24 domains n=1 Tax=Chitinasiproducens palmae TaxID=1770053 RepID=A0A1H2PRU1_9BURK|nr:helix-turn-helix transcriptional regulator [Chitinasiproducens palmae]SDV49231.1 Phage repressor protein C, contains Cro/C1-type HTH and peptisase s24 domains [Chitinasiproducens palmae]
MNLSERIQHILDETQADQVQLAEAAGVTKGTVSQWLTGQIKSIKLEYAVGIQDRYGYNAVWLVMGKGNPRAPGSNAGAPAPIPSDRMRRVPVLGVSQLGDNGFWVPIEYPVGQGDGYIDFPTTDEGAYAVRCKGDSMMPRIRDGEFVIIEPNHPVMPGDEVLVRAHDGRVLVKTFLYKRDSRVHLLSVNREHAPIAIDEGDVDQMHYVVAIVKPAMWMPD